MRVVLTRIWFLIVLSLSAVTVGILLTASTQQWLWVAIAGSVLTVVGAIAANRKLVRLGVSEMLVSNVPIGGGAILPTQDDLAVAHEEDLDDRASILAAILILVGTPLQVFGYLMSG